MLNLAISTWLYETNVDSHEKQLALKLNHLIRREDLYAVTQEISLEKHLQFDKKNSAHTKILADAMEALLGAIFLDSDFQTAQRVARKLWAKHFQIETWEAAEPDAKSLLQDWTQKHFKTLPRYQLLSKTGADHAPILTLLLEVFSSPSEVKPIDSLCAEGPSRRSVEQKLARDMLKKLKKPTLPNRKFSCCI